LGNRRANPESTFLSGGNQSNQAHLYIYRTFHVCFDDIPERYKSPATGREVDWLLIGFSPGKANLSLYLTINIKDHEAMLQKLGKHKTGVGCLYINKLADIDVEVLREMIESSLNRK